MHKEYCKECEEELDLDCGCTMNLSTDCIIYQGDELPDYSIIQGQTLTEILVKIFENLDELFKNSPITNGKNVGGGVKIFKQRNRNKELEFRTIVPTESIKPLQKNSEELEFNVDKSWVEKIVLENQTTVDIDNIGDGVKILVNDPSGKKLIRSLKSLDSDLILSLQDDTITVKNNRNFLETPLKSIGSGAPIYKGKINNSNEIKSIKSNNLILKDDGNTITINAQPSQDIPLEDILQRLVHPGFIQDYYGNYNNIPKGWFICDGTNGTPDLRGVFIVGYDNRKQDYNDIGKTGGEEFTTLTEEQIPSHTHNGTSDYQGEHYHQTLVNRADDGFVNYPTSTTSTNVRRRTGDHSENYALTRSSVPSEPNVGKTSTNGGHSHSLEISKSGGGKSHENRPPYYVLIKIMYKG